MSETVANWHDQNKDPLAEAKLKYEKERNSYGQPVELGELGNAKDRSGGYQIYCIVTRQEEFSSDQQTFLETYQAKTKRSLLKPDFISGLMRMTILETEQY